MARACFALMEGPLVASSVASHGRGRGVVPGCGACPVAVVGADLHATPAAERLSLRAGECRCVRATRGGRQL